MARQFSCPVDDFKVQAENDDEVIELVKKHASMHEGGPHDNADEDDIREQITET